MFVRWRGFADPTWEPVDFLEETEALEAFETIYGPVMTNDGPREQYEKPSAPRRSRRRGDGG